MTQNQKMTSSSNKKGTHNKITSKQIVAIAGVVLLAALYVITLIVAFADNSASGKLFSLCLFATVAIPLLIWIYTWMYGKLTNRHTFADLDIGGNEQNKDHKEHNMK